MKRALFAITSVFVFFFSGTTLLSQDVSFKSDTTWVYSYNSVTDSAFVQLSLHRQRDSANTTWSETLTSTELAGIWSTGSAFYYEKGDHGRILRRIQYSWDAVIKEWGETKMQEHSYDAQNNDTLYLSFYKNSPDEEWSSNQGKRYENSYDEQDRLVMKVTYQGYPDAMNIKEKLEYTYDTSGNIIEKLGYTWDGVDWTINSRSVSSYTDFGKIEEQVQYKWNQTEWENYVTLSLEYDADGNNTLYEVNIWDQASGEWWIQYRDITTFGENGEQLSWTSYQRYEPAEDFIIWKREYAYDLAGRINCNTRFDWNWTTDLFELSEKRFIHYGGFEFSCYDSICEGDAYLWEGHEIDTEGIYREELVSVTGTDSIRTLHLSVNPNPAAFVIVGEVAAVEDQPLLYTAPENPDVGYWWSVVNGNMASDNPNDTLEVVWGSPGDGEVAAWALNIHGCSSDTTALQILVGSSRVNDLSAAEFVLYPVPVKEVLQVQCDLDFLEIEVVDLSGREVVTANGISVDLSHLEAGTYLVRLKDREGALIGTRKIIKE